MSANTPATPVQHGSILLLRTPPERKTAFSRFSRHLKKGNALQTTTFQQSDQREQRRRSTSVFFLFRRFLHTRARLWTLWLSTIAQALMWTLGQAQGCQRSPQAPHGAAKASCRALRACPDFEREPTPFLLGTQGGSRAEGVGGAAHKGGRRGERSEDGGAARSPPRYCGGIFVFGGILAFSSALTEI